MNIRCIATTASLDTRGPYVHEVQVDMDWLRIMVRGKRYGYRITQFNRLVFQDGKPYTTAILSHYGPDEGRFPGIPIKLLAWAER